MSTPKKTKKKGKGPLIAGVAAAGLIGAGILLFSGKANAAEGGSGGSGGDGSGGGGHAGGGGNRPGGGGSGGGSGGGGGGGSGSGGSGSGGGAGKPDGFYWGDRNKIPAWFDFESNQIWISPDRTAAAAGYLFFMDGYEDDGERDTWDVDDITFAVSEGDIAPPDRDRDHRTDPVPDLEEVLARSDETTVFSWVADYFGIAVSLEEAVFLTEEKFLTDLIDQAAILSGGDAGIELDFDGPLGGFYGYTLQRLKDGREALYGNNWPWGEGEGALLS